MKGLLIRPGMLLRAIERWPDQHTPGLLRLSYLRLHLIVAFVLLAGSLLRAGQPVPAQLAKEAERARHEGRIVRAYMLYAEAAAREPANSSYVSNRDALAPAAKLLLKADIEKADIAGDVREAERSAGTPGKSPKSEPPVELATVSAWKQDEPLAAIPKLQPSSALASFNTKADERTLFQQVAAAYGVRATFDPQLEPKSDLRFKLDSVDFRTAMEALTELTDAFVFPLSDKHIFVARDTENKRQELEPEILLTFPLPNALGQKDLIEAATAVRSLLGGRAVGWDSVSRTVMVRDRATRARVAYALLESILLPKAQVALEVQVLTLDTDRNYHYGLALPTAFNLAGFSKIGGFKTIVPAFSTAASFVTFGGASAIFGVGLGDAKFFANYTNSVSHSLYDATVVVSDGQAANFHVGDQYPIPQSLYSGTGSSTSGISSAFAQLTFVDLGLILKLTPRVNGEGDIAIGVEAAYKALGDQVFNTVPSVLQREFKGSVMLREGELAVIAGLDSNIESTTRNGMVGLSQIPGLDQVLSENTRDKQTSQTLILVKPVITRLPMSNTISPQFLLGPMRGRRVLL